MLFGETGETIGETWGNRGKQCGKQGETGEAIREAIGETWRNRGNN